MDSSGAKTIYFNYTGSKFQMMRDGIIDEYRSYNISEELEKQWLEELINDEFNNLEFGDYNTSFRLFYTIQHHGLTEYFDRLAEFITANARISTERYKALVYIDKTLDIIEKFGPTKLDLAIKEKIRFMRIRKQYE